MNRIFKRCAAGALIFAISASAQADPLLLLLLRMMRDQAISNSVEAGLAPLQKPGAPGAPTFGYAMPTAPLEGAQLRKLIDDSFLYLDRSQREDLYSALQKILDDPENARVKPMLIAEFRLKAQSVREGYIGLQKLSTAEKRALVMQAREGFIQLPEAERQELIGALKSRTLPVPRDLNDTIVAEFSSVPMLPQTQTVSKIE